MKSPKTPIEKLIEIEERAQELARQRELNETRWEKAYNEARRSPEWNEYCEKNGICTHYNYGDVIC